MQLELPVTDC